MKVTETTTGPIAHRTYTGHPATLTFEVDGRKITVGLVATIDLGELDGFRCVQVHGKSNGKAIITDPRMNTDALTELVFGKGKDEPPDHDAEFDALIRDLKGTE